MEALLMHESLNQSMSPYKPQIRNPRIIQHYPFTSMPSEKYSPFHFQTVGFLQQAPPTPPFLSRSYPPYPSQPPLLPLPPAAAPLRRAVSQSFSGPPSRKKPNHSSRVKDSSSSTHKKPSKPLNQKSSKQPSKNVTVSSTNAFPKELPKDVPKVLPLRSSSGSINTNANNCMNNTNMSLPFAPKQMGDDGYMFSGSVAFTISSPPPSSLPLPTFSLRPKLSCNAEAVTGSGSATDDLRRILRLS